MRKKKTPAKSQLFIIERREDEERDSEENGWWIEETDTELYETNDPKKATIYTWVDAHKLKLSLQKSTLYGVVPRHYRVPTYTEQVEEIEKENLISENNPFFTKKKKEPAKKTPVQENPFFKSKKVKPIINDPLGLWKK